MDEENISANHGPPLPEHLTFDNETLYHILTYTIFLLAGMNTDKAISDVLQNTIHAISQGYIFDIDDMFLRILMDSAQCPKTIKVFTPPNGFRKWLTMKRRPNILLKSVKKVSCLLCVIH